MITVPEYVVRGVRACVYAVTVAQKAHFYIPRATAPPICHFKTLTIKYKKNKNKMMSPRNEKVLMITRDITMDKNHY